MAAPAMSISTARFVGRAAELVTLTDALAGATAGATATVLVGGEGGVGKTRLVQEFSGRARESGARVLRGACIGLAVGELPYAPLVEVLRTLIRDLGSQTVREVAGRAYPELTRLVPFLDDTAESLDTAEPLAQGPASQARLFEAVLRLLHRLAEQAPLVLIIEDMQWADRSTLDLLSFLVATLTQERLLVVASFRSSDLHPGHPLRAVLAELGRSGRTRRLELARFTEVEHTEFLTAMIGTAPSHSLVRQVFELSDGNAYFAEELAAAGAIDGPSGDRGPLPRSIHDVVLARVEVLPADARYVLDVIATAGRKIRHQLLAAVSELPEDRLTGALRACVAHHVLVTDQVAGTYVFRHAIAREVVYEDVLPGERARLHAALAHALTARPRLSPSDGPAFAAELAHHWHEAGELPSALAAAVAAASIAAHSCAFAESRQLHQRALLLWHRVPDPAGIAGASRRQLLERGAEAARWAGQIATAIEWVQEALREIPPDGPPTERAALWERLGRYRWEAGDGEGSVAAYEEAIDTLAGEPPSGLRASALGGQATAYVLAGRYSVGLRLATEAVGMARAVGARSAESRALNMAGVALTMTGDPEEGVRSLRAALEIAETMADPEELFRAYSNLGFALEKAGRLEDSLRVARSGLGRSRDLSVELTGGGVLLTNAAAVLSLLGRWDEVVDVATDALHRDVPAGFAMYLHLLLGEIDIGRGRFIEAARRLAVAQEMSQRLRESQFTGQLHGYLAEIAIWQCQPEAVRDAVRAGLAAVSEDGPLTLYLCALGLRGEADRTHRAVVRARRRGSDAGDSGEAGPDFAVELAARVAATVTRLPAQPLPEVVALHLLCHAEQARIEGRDVATQWASVADQWERIGRPYPTAYARWREGATALDDRTPRAAPALRQAHLLAARLGAQPLRQEIEVLARRARIDLGAPPASPPSPASLPGPGRPGLTPRERQVLDHLVAGSSNRIIARRLFIAEKTASVHVSNILTKLSAASRGEAAAIALRLGMVSPHPDSQEETWHD